MLKWTLRVILSLMVLFSGAVMIFTGCMTFRKTDRQVERYFHKKGVPVHIRHDVFAGRPVRYLETGAGADSGNLVIFVHGAPGSSADFHSYLADSALLQHTRLITVDRWGYGFSDYGNAETDIARQAGLIGYLLERYQPAKAVLVGHSYGGPVVGKCAADFPERLRGIVMLAPVNDPDNEPMFWFANFARWKATRWLLSGALKVSGDEKFSHAAALDRIRNDWSTIRIPVVHIHGDKDGLAPSSNIDFSRDHIPAPYLKLIPLTGTGHFIPWTDYEIVRRELLTLLEINASGQHEGKAIPEQPSENNNK